MNVIGKNIKHSLLTAIVTCLVLSACAPTPNRPDHGHITTPTSVDSDIPAPVSRVPYLEPPRAAAPLETYSIVVTDVPVAGGCA